MIWLLVSNNPVVKIFHFNPFGSFLWDFDKEKYKTTDSSLGIVTTFKVVGVGPITLSVIIQKQIKPF